MDGSARRLACLALGLLLIAAAPASPPASPWGEVDRLVEAGRPRAALERVEEILAAARAAGDDAEQARALARATELRGELGGFETAVRELQEAEWPEAPVPRLAVQLIYARSLATYARAYAGDIYGRERTVGPDEVDLRAWTREQIDAEIGRVYREAWAQRDEWGAHGFGELADLFFGLDEYPPHILGTLRDVVSYQWAAYLAQSTGAAAGGALGPDLELLVDGGPEDLPAPGEPAAGAPADEVHPLARLAAILADLEAWHLERGEPEAAFEARHARLAWLWQTRPAERDAVRQALARRLEELGSDWPWWSRGMATLVAWTDVDDAPDARVRARELALRCVRPDPESFGARRCRHHLATIEAPDFRVQAMSADGSGERSILVDHRNLEALWFRAYAFDLASTVGSARDGSLLPSHQQVPEILEGRRPAAEWRVDLPETPDYRNHRSYVTPPLSAPGLYLVVASARSDFAVEENQRAAVNLIVTDLVLLVRQEADRLDVTALSGETGEPRPGARIDLYRADWQAGHRRVTSARTGEDGRVELRLESSRRSYFVLGHEGEHSALDPRYVSSWRSPSESRERDGCLFYTDRAVYRPGQTVRWKVVFYRGVAAAGRFRTHPGHAAAVRLTDPNQEVVAEERVTGNDFGTASGRFEIPAGRLLGSWYVGAHPGCGASVRVEEYRRPTFEVTLDQPGEALRLGRPARLTGGARYYFGQPVAGADVAWRVTREAVHTGGGYPYRAPAFRSAEVVAAGRAELDASGRFEVAFTPQGPGQAPGQGPEAAGGWHYRYRLDADVTSPGGETRSASRSFAVGAVAVAARIETEAGFHRSGEPVTLSVLRTDLDGTPRAGSGRWRLVRLVAPERALLPAELPPPSPPGAGGVFRTAGDRLRPRWDTGYDPRVLLDSWPAGSEVAAGHLEHGDDGEAELSAGRLSPGAYRLVYQTEDRFGERFETHRELVVAGRGNGFELPVAALVLAERETVAPGGTARFLVHSGLPGQPMLVEIQRRVGPPERRWLAAGDGPHVLELPVGPELRGGVAVTLTVLRDHQVVQLTDRVAVPWSDRELAVELSSFRDRLRPGEREEWRVTVRGPDGEALAEGAAEVLAAMYDRSLDLFAPHRPPSPLGLYPQLGYFLLPRASLGFGGPVWWQREGWVRLPEYPSLAGDRGEPGRRGGAWGFGSHAFGVDGVVITDMAAIGASPTYYDFDQYEEIRVTSESPLLDESLPAPPAPPPPPPAPAPQSQSPSPAPSGVVPRTDFAETAFFEPHLLTEADGSVSFAFTVPDTVTEWNVWLQAVTRDLRAGGAEARARTVKELLVRPYLPRFLREGDRAEVRVVVDNAGDEALRGTLSIELFDPEAGYSRLADFGLTEAQVRDLPFEVAPGESTTFTVRLAVPAGVGAVAFRATATAGQWSDGEQRPLPVLPGRFHLAQSRFAALHDAERETLRFADLAAADDDPTLRHDRLVVTLDAQLFDAVLRALPYLVEYPYECTEQTLNRFLSTSVLSSVFDRYPAVAARARELARRETRLEPWQRDDPNRKMALVETPWLVRSRGGDGEDDLIPVLDPVVAAAHRDAALLRLGQSQTSLGGFPWFAGGPPSPYLTLYLLQGFSRALDAGVEVPRNMVARAWSYARHHFEDELRRSVAGDPCCGPDAVFLAYVLSSYPESGTVDWTGGAFGAKDRRAVLDAAFRDWQERSPLQKAQLALALHRAGRWEDARLVFDSLMDGARTDPELGTSWAPEERAWLWYNDTVEMHAYALRAMNELAPDDPRRHGVVQWLLLDRNLGHWKSTRATAEVIHALVEYLEREGELAVREEVRVEVQTSSGLISRSFVFEPDAPPAGPTRLVVPGEEVTPATAEVTVEKATPGFLFASATWHFSTERPPASGDGDLLAVERRFFRRVAGPGGFTLEPLAAGDAVAVGDQVAVQLSIRARHAAEYVHLRDPRGAGFEPEAVVSGHRWDQGVARYEEVRDSGLDLFFERLPAGEHTFTHHLRATTAGTFRVAPATLQSMYAPEFTAHSSGRALRVRVAD